MSELFPLVTEIGRRVDLIQASLIALMAFWFILCNAAMVYFLFKYRRKGPNDKVSTVRGNHVLEIVWTVVPTLICLIIFWAGIDVWSDMRTMPDDALEINVQGRKWSWNFTYSDPKGEYTVGTPGAEASQAEEHHSLDGRVTTQDLFVPAGRNILFTMTSEDVLHSMYIPEFRVKEDVVPALFTKLWFRAEKPGRYQIFCTEYCGDDHSGMLGSVQVLDEATWERYLRDLPLDPRDKKRVGVELGEYLFAQQNCKGCHTIDGRDLVGPTFKNLFGKTETMSDGRNITVDENYLRKSMIDPKADVVASYPDNQMTSFEGILNEEEMKALIDYIKTLKD